MNTEKESGVLCRSKSMIGLTVTVNLEKLTIFIIYVQFLILMVDFH